MTDAELCKAVAVEVMGWELPYEDEPDLFANEHGGDEYLTLTWSDAGRVIEKLSDYGMYIRTSNMCREEVEVFSITNGLALAHVIEDDFPRAVFMAALQAVRGKEDGNG